MEPNEREKKLAKETVRGAIIAEPSTVNGNDISRCRETVMAYAVARALASCRTEPTADDRRAAIEWVAYFVGVPIEDLDLRGCDQIITKAEGFLAAARADEREKLGVLDEEEETGLAKNLDEFLSEYGFNKGSTVDSAAEYEQIYSTVTDWAAAQAARVKALEEAGREVLEIFSPEEQECVVKLAALVAEEVEK